MGDHEITTCDYVAWLDIHEAVRLHTAHYCPDWDYDWIEPGSPEMECCTCQ